ncbi:type IV secretory system conjugative DNA transfer family protein [uncultured Selenomonas sp.]|uniref:type IV secretory system conjugative DNA transfer family protein n=1 Tax=uncultured Selenomonas sp. TaxID=159275 RepID=UPI0028EC313D|nr:type IV secretory system conjugative DNA transfer family protein [uncultured Selenomonas sp.]
MNEQEKKEQNKTLFLCLLFAGITYVAAQWLTTQAIADHLEYSPLLPGEIAGHIYQPFAHRTWRDDPQIAAAIPRTLAQYAFLPWIVYLVGGLVIYQFHKSRQRMTSHGTADFAKEKDIKEAGLAIRENGFVVGINPFNEKLMLHNGPEHILLVAPTRSGKGVCNMIPTGICWKHSIFFFDPKAELWNFTAGWRKKHFGQKVMKFEPLCKDGSAAKWNPFAEIDFQSFEELTDVSTISEMMVKTGDGGSKDPFWENSAAALINGVILHLLYKHYQEKRLLPCPSDVMSFLSSPGMSTDKLFASMKIYPHISKEEFLEQNGKKNMLKEIYGEYVEDFRPYTILPHFAEAVAANEVCAKAYEEALQEGRHAKPPKSNLELLREAIIAAEEAGETIDFAAPDLSECTQKQDIDQMISGQDMTSPWYKLLVHPKVAEAAANMYNGAEQTRASIMQTAQTSMAVYQDPLVKANTAVSDFSLRDLLDPSQEVSLYLVLQPNDIDKLRPILRLFVNTMLSKLVRDMKFAADGEKEQKKQRLLLMLDEFPQLGKLESIEKTLAICAGYGVKICIVAQSMGQLNKIYTKDNAIPGNCHVQIYFTPTLEDGGGTAKTLSDTLGDQTIHSYSKSSNGKMFEGSTSTSQMARKLMTPDEVRRMPADRELVFVAGFRPIYGKKLFYFKQKFFTDRTKTPPPTFSDLRTEVKSYAQLFAVHRADRAAAEERLREVQEARAAAMTASPVPIEEIPIRLEKYDEPAAKENPTAFGQDETWDEAATNAAGGEDSQPQDAEEIMTFAQRKEMLLAKRRKEEQQDGT